jgi:hypothetical protein
MAITIINLFIKLRQNLEFTRLQSETVSEQKDK